MHHEKLRKHADGGKSGRPDFGLERDLVAGGDHRKFEDDSRSLVAPPCCVRYHGICYFDGRIKVGHGADC